MEERKGRCKTIIEETNKKRKKGEGEREDGKVIEIMEIIKNTRGKEGKRVVIEILKR